jgi:hypothetical protein
VAHSTVGTETMARGAAAACSSLKLKHEVRRTRPEPSAKGASNAQQSAKSGRYDRLSCVPRYDVPTTARMRLTLRSFCAARRFQTFAGYAEVRGFHTELGGVVTLCSKTARQQFSNRSGPARHSRLEAKIVDQRQLFGRKHEL